MSEAQGLERFVVAQEQIYARALEEIRRGKKRSHWMWFIFPQLAGLGRSAMAQRYAIADEAEARAYLAHPLLGARYVECVSALQDLIGSDAVRSEEHTSELQSLMRISYVVFCLKKKKQNKSNTP